MARRDVPWTGSLVGLSIGLMVLGIASAAHANVALTAFTAGITVATLARDVEHTFTEFGELVAELLKLAGILVFGALISPAFLGEIPVSGYVFAVLALLLARPLAISSALRVVAIEPVAGYGPAMVGSTRGFLRLS